MTTLLRALVIVLGGALAGVAANTARRDGLRVGAFEAPSVCDAAESAGAPLQIEPAEALRLCGNPEVVVADTRPAARFAEGHVAGAVHLPCDAGGRVASDVAARWQSARTIVVYGEGTDDALPVAASLRRRIHRPGVRVVVMKGGFGAWDRAGLACASGPCDECKETGTP
jgi:rhodanese-related sulfurtransferase